MWPHNKTCFWHLQDPLKTTTKQKRGSFLMIQRQSDVWCLACLFLWYFVYISEARGWGLNPLLCWHHACCVNSCKCKQCLPIHKSFSNKNSQAKRNFWTNFTKLRKKFPDPITRIQRPSWKFPFLTTKIFNVSPRVCCISQTTDNPWKLSRNFFPTPSGSFPLRKVSCYLLGWLRTVCPLELCCNRGGAGRDRSTQLSWSGCLALKLFRQTCRSLLAGFLLSLRVQRVGGDWFLAYFTLFFSSTFHCNSDGLWRQMSL